MATTDEYIRKIRKKQRAGLLGLWKAILKRNTIGWEPGKAFEFLVLRAFELEGGTIRWPYSVPLFDEIVEQVGGAVHLPQYNLSILIECKDQSTAVNIEPLSKMRNQLHRRPSNTIGAVFSTSGYTEPALVLSRFNAPQTILLWEKEHISYCLANGSLIYGMVLKYQKAIEEGVSNFDITVNV